MGLTPRPPAKRDIPIGDAAARVAGVIKKLMDSGESVVDLGCGFELRTLTLPRGATRRVVVSVTAGGKPVEPVPGRVLDPELASAFLISSGPILNARQGHPPLG